jgi:hypothetical protein
MTTVRDALIAARELISSPQRWTTAWYARDSNGAPVDPLDASACKWCALGALRHVTGSANEIAPAIAACRTALMQQIPGESVNTLNDYSGHGAVLSMFDRAIAALETP